MRHFGIFAKYWQPGTVKTRLAETMGSLAASRVYREFVCALLQRLNRVADRQVLAVTPPEQIAEFQQVAGPNWEVWPQASGDLGARMAAFFQDCFDAGARRVVLIGSDSPTLPETYIRDAFQQLERHSVVLGPSEDGGYYLIGAAETVPPIFSKIRWSSHQVFEATIHRLEQTGRSFATLPLWYDVDEVNGLRRLRDELRDCATGDGPLSDLLAVIEASFSQPE